MQQEQSPPMDNVLSEPKEVSKGNSDKQLFEGAVCSTLPTGTMNSAESIISPASIDEEESNANSVNGEDSSLPGSEKTSTPFNVNENITHNDEESGAFAEAKKTYTRILENEYKRGTGAKLPRDYMPCICKYDHLNDPRWEACGEKSDCINRALFIECTVDDCPVGEQYCLNRRFQKREYAPIQVIKTDKKGFGVRAMTDLETNRFIVEYCGEILPKAGFLKRTKEYHTTGVKHFYFMSLTKDEMIDAGKKGNLSRFLNHSCAPNCVLQKWVVDSRVRMGIFANRAISAGEELTFDYKFERYGNEAQKCYCGEPTCAGVIGGSKNSNVGFDLDDEEEEEEVESQELREPKEETPLEKVEDVQKLVKSMLYNTGKARKVKRLLRKLEITESPQIKRKFLLFHGLLVLKSCLSHYIISDIPLCFQILQVLSNLPIASRNSIVDHKVSELVSKLSDCSACEVADMAKALVEKWATLPLLYRIPKRSKLDLEAEKESKPQKDEDSQDRSEKREASNNKIKRRDSDNYSDRYGSRRDSEDNKKRKLDSESRDGSGSKSQSNGASKLKETSRYQSSRVSGSSSYRDSPSESRDREASSSSVDARKLPNNWKCAISKDDGRTYYYNTVTQATQWDFPEEIDIPFSPLRDAPATIVEKTTSSGPIASVNNISQSDLDAIVEEATKKAAERRLEEEKSLMKASSRNAISKPLKSTLEIQEAKLRNAISEEVVRMLSRCKSQMDNDTFKKLAKKYTQMIVEKEMREMRPGTRVSSSVSDEMRRKIKKLVYTKLKSMGYDCRRVDHKSGGGSEMQFSP